MPNAKSETLRRQTPLQLLLVLLMIFILISGGCSVARWAGLADNEEDRSPERTFVGLVAADEPQAARIAHDILLDGGNAFDAATALYFTLSVTLPSHASLGGGGACVTHDQTRGKSEALEFYAQAARDKGRAQRPAAIPGSMRGFFALHARYGKLNWEKVIFPAESLARDGFDVSRSLASHLQQAKIFIEADAESRRLFLRSDGNLVEPGDIVRMPDLASMLAVLRARGPGPFYNGYLANVYASVAQQVGADMTTEKLRAMRPTWTRPLGARLSEDIRAIMLPPPAAASLIGLQIYGMVSEVGNYRERPVRERAHLFSEVSMLALGDRRRWIRPKGYPPAQISSLEEESGRSLQPRYWRKLMSPYQPRRHAKPGEVIDSIDEELENPFGSGFVVADREGNAVACMVTTNNLFGIGRMAPGTGIFIAASPEITHGGAISFGPTILLARGERHPVFYAAIAGSGGVTVSTVTARLFLGLFDEGLTLSRVMGIPRYHHSGAPDILYYEAGSPDEEIADLVERGHELRRYPDEKGRSPARLNAIQCRFGLPSSHTGPGCEAVTDPRGHGLAFGVETL